MLKDRTPAMLLLLAGVFVLLAALSATMGCEGGKKTNVYVVYTGGDSNRGKAAIERYRCGACHMIPGIPDANGLVGPPLIKWGRRTYVGGELPNTPDNLVRWIMSPPSVEPGTAMPALGLSEQEARDVAAYLYTIR